MFIDYSPISQIFYFSLANLPRNLVNKSFRRNVDEENKTVSFDLIIDFKAESKEKVKDEVVKEIKEKYPEYNYYVILDTDFSD